MKFALIICTYMRPKAIMQLLQSVEVQTAIPNEIIIVDGSLNSDTQVAISESGLANLQYYRVTEADRGLTKQRNYGIGKVNLEMEVVCFLDDDVVLKTNYFEELLTTYKVYPKALGVGGAICNENKFEYVGHDYIPNQSEYFFDGYKQKDGSRFILRKKLGLDSDCPPGYSSLYSHGRSVGFLPLSGKTYPVEMLMGGVASFKKEIFEQLQFSTYFEGYGLYEDADFSLRVAKKGALYVNTAAQLFHYHDAAGRPNKYQYGKMVVRNGWYVWRVKNPNPTFEHRYKWNAITLLLTAIRYTNVVTTTNRVEALTEAIGRTVGWFSLLLSKPK